MDNSYLPDILVLSHFHVDHYNGLLYASNNYGQFPRLSIRRVFYPRIPDFKNREKFAIYLFAMNCRVLGRETGVMEIDFLNAVKRITTTPFTHTPLFKGCKIRLDNSSVFRVLWPPETIDDGQTLSVICRALEDFERAIEKDEETRELYKEVREKGIFRVYLDEQVRAPSQEHGRKYMSYSYESRKLPRVVNRANRSLRKAANHLSLAFLADNRFLFLGDTEAWEIRKIVGDLQSEGEKNFHIFITPHHGTHWSESLRNLRCVCSITSKSKKQRLKPGFRHISQRVIKTSIHGDRVIPIPPTRAQGSGS